MLIKSSRHAYTTPLTSAPSSTRYQEERSNTVILKSKPLDAGLFNGLRNLAGTMGPPNKTKMLEALQNATTKMKVKSVRFPVNSKKGKLVSSEMMSTEPIIVFEKNQATLTDDGGEKESKTLFHQG